MKIELTKKEREFLERVKDDKFIDAED